MMSNAIHFRSFIHRFRSEGKGWDPIRQVHHSKEAPVCLVIAASLLLAWESYCSVCRTAAEESSRPTSISSVTVAKCVWHDPTQLLIWKKNQSGQLLKKLFLAKRLASDWLTELVNQSEPQFLAGNSLNICPLCFFEKSMPCLILKKDFQSRFFRSFT